MLMAVDPEPPISRTLAGLNLVVGLGASGMACIRTLRGLGVAVSAMDSRAQPPGLGAVVSAYPDLPLHLGDFAAPDLERAARIFLSPGVDPRAPELAAARARGVPVWSEIELFAHLATAPVVAITGSNGKSSVTTLLGDMAARADLRVAVGGNLGPPALDLLEPEVELYVLELSSFQLEATYSLTPKAATVLNLSADHLDRYSDLDQYAAAKARVFGPAGSSDCIQVLNGDDPGVRAMARPGAAVVEFTLDEPSAEGFGIFHGAGGDWLGRGSEPWLAAAELHVGGRHQQANVLAALALGHALGLPRDPMLEAARVFRGLPHRTQRVGRGRGLTFYDDSKGTNVGATVAAVAGLPAPLVVILGGQGKGQDFAPLAPAFAGRVRGAVLIGEAAEEIAAALRAGLGADFPLRRAADMGAAVTAATELAESGDTVLLSPACASFDLFSGYAQRGQDFAQAVMEWLA